MLKEPSECWRNELYLRPEKRMDLEDAKYLLISLKQVLEKHNIVIMPMFGTLLGAIREHNFIKKDSDIDVVTSADNVQAIFDLRPELEKVGINLYCYVLPWIFTFEYKEITCDIYPVYESAWPWTSRYSLLLEKYIRKSFFEQTEDYEFLGEHFQVPANPEKLLTYLYGGDWRVPQSKKPRIESPLFVHRYLHRFIQRGIRYIRRHVLKK
mgnify:CR=1 FL=1